MQSREPRVDLGARCPRHRHRHVRLRRHHLGVPDPRTDRASSRPGPPLGRTVSDALAPSGSAPRTWPRSWSRTSISTTPAASATSPQRSRRPRSSCTRPAHGTSSTRSACSPALVACSDRRGRRVRRCCARPPPRGSARSAPPASSTSVTVARSRPSTHRGMRRTTSGCSTPATATSTSATPPASTSPSRGPAAGDAAAGLRPRARGRQHRSLPRRAPNRLLFSHFGPVIDVEDDPGPFGEELGCGSTWCARRGGWARPRPRRRTGPGPHARALRRVPRRPGPPRATRTSTPTGPTCSASCAGSTRSSRIDRAEASDQSAAGAASRRRLRVLLRSCRPRPPARRAAPSRRRDAPRGRVDGDRGEPRPAPRPRDRPRAARRRTRTAAEPSTARRLGVGSATCSVDDRRLGLTQVAARAGGDDEQLHPRRPVQPGDLRRAAR